MSAFVVDPKTINAIVSSMVIALNQEGKYPHNYPDLRYLESDLRDSVTNGPEELGESMYQMNINAVMQRYPGDDINSLPGSYDGGRLVDYTYKFTPSTNPVRVYKSLQCYLYQCSEGYVPELPLFKALTEYKAALAEAIVTSSPVYEAAEWG